MVNNQDVDSSPPEVKRKRSSNWTEEDKELLKSLIRLRLKEVEDKNTDTKTNNAKQKAWLWIEERFNRMCHGSKRTVIQLKSQWIVTKINAKKKNSKEANKTTRCPQSPALVLSESSFVADTGLFPPNEYIVEKIEFDSDFEAPPLSTRSSPVEYKFNVEEAKDLPVEEPITQIIPDVHSDLPIEAPVPPRTKKKTKRMINNNVADEKIKEVAKFDLKCREELHRLQVLNEEKKSRNLDLEYEILKEKHRQLKQERN